MEDASETDSIQIPRKNRRGYRITLRLFYAFIGGYVLLCTAMFGCQDSLLFPGHSSQGKDASRHVDTPPPTEVVNFSASDGTALSGRFCPLTSGAERVPTVLYFYGNASCAAWTIGEVELLRSLGCNVFVPDFEGYGMSASTPSEKNFYATADAAWDYLQSRPGIDHKKIIIMGWSIGSAVAIDLASRKPAAGLMTFSAFTRLEDVAHHKYPWLPTRWLLSSRFDNLSKLATIHMPVLIVHGQNDTLVPPVMAHVLADTLGAKAERIELKGADHNTVFDVDTPNLRIAIQRLLNRVSMQSQPVQHTAI